MSEGRNRCIGSPKTQGSAGQRRLAIDVLQRLQHSKLVKLEVGVKGISTEIPVLYTFYPVKAFQDQVIIWPEDGGSLPKGHWIQLSPQSFHMAWARLFRTNHHLEDPADGGDVTPARRSFFAPRRSGIHFGELNKTEFPGATWCNNHTTMTTESKVIQNLAPRFLLLQKLIQLFCQDTLLFGM